MCMIINEKELSRRDAVPRLRLDVESKCCFAASCEEQPPQAHSITARLSALALPDWDKDEWPERTNSRTPETAHVITPEETLETSAAGSPTPPQLRWETQKQMATPARHEQQRFGNILKLGGCRQTGQRACVRTDGAQPGKGRRCTRYQLQLHGSAASTTGQRGRLGPGSH